MDEAGEKKTHDDPPQPPSGDAAKPSTSSAPSSSSAPSTPSTSSAPSGWRPLPPKVSRPDPFALREPMPKHQGPTPESAPADGGAQQAPTGQPPMRTAHAWQRPATPPTDVPERTEGSTGVTTPPRPATPPSAPSRPLTSPPPVVRPSIEPARAPSPPIPTHTSAGAGSSTLDRPTVAMPPVTASPVHAPTTLPPTTLPSTAPARMPTPTPAPPTTSRPAASEPARVPTTTPAGARRVRKAKVQIRKFDPWAILRFSLVFYLCMLLIALLAIALIFTMLKAFGAIDNFEKFMASLQFEVTITGGFLFKWVFLLGLGGVVIASVMTVFMAFLYNLIADVVGGVEMQLTERD